MTLHSYRPAPKFGCGMWGHSPIKVEKRPGRNDKCPCGSGKKVKHCCPERAKP